MSCRQTPEGKFRELLLFQSGLVLREVFDKMAGKLFLADISAGGEMQLWSAQSENIIFFSQIPPQSHF